MGAAWEGHAMCESAFNVFKTTIMKANLLGDFMCSEMNSTNTATINMASNAAKLPLDILE